MPLTKDWPRGPQALASGCPWAVPWPPGSCPLSSWGPLSGQRLGLPISPGRLWASLPPCPFPSSLASPSTLAFPKGESNPIAPTLGRSPPPVTQLFAPLSIQALSPSLFPFPPLSPGQLLLILLRPSPGTPTSRKPSLTEPLPIPISFCISLSAGQ